MNSGHWIYNTSMTFNMHGTMCTVEEQSCILFLLDATPRKREESFNQRLPLLALLSHFSQANSVRPHRWQPTRLPRPWVSPGKNTGVGCHFLLQSIKVKMKSLSRIWLLATSWTAAYQAPLSMGFSRQEYWSGVPLPSPLLAQHHPRYRSDSVLPHG